jgi:transcriptional regulator with XRE-family HTH domain
VSRKGRPGGITIVIGVVRAARMRRCLTQTELAEATGLSARTISAVEAGLPIAPSTARAIACALELELDRLLATGA